MNSKAAGADEIANECMSYEEVVITMMILVYDSSWGYELGKRVKR